MEAILYYYIKVPSYLGTLVKKKATLSFLPLFKLSLDGLFVVYIDTATNSTKQNKTKKKNKMVKNIYLIKKYITSL